jgi:hypothetical protein
MDLNIFATRVDSDTAILPRMEKTLPARTAFRKT